MCFRVNSELLIHLEFELLNFLGILEAINVHLYPWTSFILKINVAVQNHMLAYQYNKYLYRDTEDSLRDFQKIPPIYIQQWKIKISSRSPHVTRYLLEEDVMI